MKTKTEQFDIWDALGVVAVTILGALAFYLFLVATPPQNSAECDYWADQLERAEAAAGGAR